MIKESKFVLSHKPFAIDLSTVRLTASRHGETGAWSLSGTCQAVWYRRKDGVTRACLGPLRLWAQWLREEPDLSGPEAMLGNKLDGRYGGDTQGRWDGTGYWGSEIPSVQRDHLVILRPMLGNYPCAPAGYDGWWTFGGRS